MNNKQGLVGATVKRIRGYIKLRRALNSLNGALPDATYEELSAFNDECAICRVRNYMFFIFRTALLVGGEVIDSENYRDQWLGLKSCPAIIFSILHA